MDYPENASIIDPQEQQSDYYDRYVVLRSCPLPNASNCTLHLVSFCTLPVGRKLSFLFWSFTIGILRKISFLASRTLASHQISTKATNKSPSSSTLSFNFTQPTIEMANMVELDRFPFGLITAVSSLRTSIILVGVRLFWGSTSWTPFSQLIRFDRICAVCIGTTPNGTFVNAMKLMDQTSPAPYHVYDFKDAYLSIFQEYKKTRVAVFGNYEIIR